MAFPRLKPAGVAALSTLLIGGAFAPSASAAPLPSTFATPTENMTTPNWSGLDVREPGALGELPATTGVAVREVPMDVSLHLDNAAVNQRYAHTTVDQHGNTAPSTAAIYLPEGPAPDGG